MNETVATLYGIASIKLTKPEPEIPKIEEEEKIELSDESPLRLKEMLWEVTPKCNKDCSYCGSKILKMQMELPLDSYKIIVENLLNYPPEEITLTGGEPGMCRHLEWILDSLSQKMKVKVVTNGLVLDKLGPSQSKKFAQIGLSINTEDDIKAKYGIYSPEKITMVTNFGTHNIWLLDKLYEYFVEENFSVWQVQLTMGDFQLPAQGIKYLRERLFSFGDSSDKNAVINLPLAQIVLADNLQLRHSCTAGTQSCSITFDGDVVPCLSERSWNKKIRVQGNLLSEQAEKNKGAYLLQHIWENKFKEQRFGKCKACRNCIDYPKEESKINWDTIKKQLDQKTWPSPGVEYTPVYGVSPRVYHYGVTEPITVMYAVWASPRVTAYAVTGTVTTSGTDYKYTVINTSDTTEEKK